MKLHGVFVTNRRIAQLFGVHPNTVTNWSKKGKVPPMIDEYCRVVGELRATVGYANDLISRKRRRKRKVV